MNSDTHKKRFCLVLIKPSHYDDDGYVIQWLRSAIPSNSLACLYGLSLQCAEEKVLGEDWTIDIQAFDETNSRIRPSLIAQLVKSADAGMVMLVGVQSNQFPRALDIAAPLRQGGLQVGLGGFHVSGTIAMLRERDPDVRRAEQMGVSLFAGEAEGRIDEMNLVVSRAVPRHEARSADSPRGGIGSSGWALGAAAEVAPD